MIFCSISNLLNVRELIVRSLKSKIVKYIIQWFVCFLCFRFSIKTKNLNLLFELRFVWNRIFVIEYSYEYIEIHILIINNKIDWFFRFDVFETIYREKICIEKCQNRNIYIDFAIIAFRQFHEIDQFESFLKNFIQKTFAIVFVQNWYSYETNVNDLNCVTNMFDK